MKKLITLFCLALAFAAAGQEKPVRKATQTEIRNGSRVNAYVPPDGLADWGSNAIPTQPVLSAVDNGTRTTLLNTNPIEIPVGTMTKLLPNPTNYTTFTNTVPFVFLYDYGTAAFNQAATTNARGTTALPAGVALGHGATFNRDSNYVSFVGYLPINADTNFDPVLLLTSPKNGTATGNGVFEVNTFTFFTSGPNTTEQTTNFYTNNFTYGAGVRPQHMAIPLTGVGPLLTNQGVMMRLTVRRWGDNASDALATSNYISGAGLQVIQKVP